VALGHCFAIGAALSLGATGGRHDHCVPDPRRVGPFATTRPRPRACGAARQHTEGRAVDASRIPPDDNPACGRPDDLFGVAHRLRDAAAVIVGRAQLLARRVRATDDVPPGQVLAGLGDIERLAKAMVDAVAALEADQGPPVPSNAPPRRGPPAAESDGRDGDDHVGV
jgi:hypothetical protein